MLDKLEEIKATIHRVVYLNPDSYYSILDVIVGDKKAIAKGIFLDPTILPGRGKESDIEYIFKGHWIKDVKYGWQFEFESSEVLNGGMLFFLVNIAKGVSVNLAQRILKEFNDKELEKILDYNPEKLLEIKGIKEKKLKKIKASWDKYKYLKKLSDFFALYDASMTNSLLLKIYNYFFAGETESEDNNGENKSDANQVVANIKENPYMLTEIRGIGFKTADRIALQLGIDEISDVRIEALVDYILLSKANDDGHTYLTFNQLIELVKENIPAETDLDRFSNLIKKIISVKKEKFYYDPVKELVALKMYKYKEDYILKDLLERQNMISSFAVTEQDAKSFIEDEEKHLGINFSREQYQTIFDIMTKKYNVFILCGYAGTGKSTISRAILDFYSKFIDYKKIACCAFTGMASKRIREVTGYYSSTIHSLLGWDGTSFAHGADKKLDYSVVLVDEASMVNLDLFYALIRAIKDDAVIIMVGDDAQLPPIGAGNVFSDLMKIEQIPKVKLMRIFRQSRNSVLTYFANFIRQGETPPFDLRNNDFRDFEFILKDIPDYFSLKKLLPEEELQLLKNNLQIEILDATIDSVKVLTSGIKSYAQRIWDIQVITAMKNTRVGTNNLNEALQDILNPQSPKTLEIKQSVLKVYDKVIHLKNKNMQSISHRNFMNHVKTKTLDDIMNDDNLIKNERIYNGSIGLVIEIEESSEVFAVLYPDFEDGKVVFYSFNDYKDIVDLGYALTIHKVQGNQFRYVIIPFTNSFYKMLNTKLTYTALTRAREKAILIGQEYAFKRGCTNIDETVRQTFLGMEK